MTALVWLSSVLVLVISLALYFLKLNKLLLSQPPDALTLSPQRWTADEILTRYDEFRDSPISITPSLPPKQGNRYIVVGGSGFLGES